MRKDRQTADQQQDQDDQKNRTETHGRRSCSAHGLSLIHIFGKLASASPGVIVFGRALFAVLALGLFARLAGQAWRALGPAQWLRLALCGLLLAGHWVSFFIAVKTAGVAIATLG